MIRHFAFTQLVVADLPRSLAWYRDLLGLETVLDTTPDRFVLLKGPGGQLALKEGLSQPGDTLLAFEVDDLDLCQSRLASAGVALAAEPKTSHEGYRRLLVRDPDGHRVSFFSWVGKPPS